MSRSCQRATFSKAIWALARTDAGEAGDLFAMVMGLRLCGMALEPFCFSEKNSSASRTSVRWRWRTLGGDLVERAGEDGEGGDVGGVAVALDDLRGDFDGAEA